MTEAMCFFMLQYLDLLLGVLVHFARAHELRLVRGPVGLEVLSVPSDVGPGPHATDASDVDIHDSIEGIMPPFRETRAKSQQRLGFKSGFKLDFKPAAAQT